MAKIAGFFVTKNTVFQMTIDTLFVAGSRVTEYRLKTIVLLESQEGVG